MKTLVFVIYDAFGDWISSNGMIRYLSEFYDEVYLVHDTPVVVPFTTHMFRDNDKIIPVEGVIDPGYECDVIDVRVGELYPNPGNVGKYFNKINKFGLGSFVSTDNASSFYTELGIDPKMRISKFDYERDFKSEDKLYNSLNLPVNYSVICEMEDGMINRKYVNGEVINLHKLTDNFLNISKIIENANEIHLVENSIALFVYHMQSIGKLKNIPINLHVYARKESHRKCDGPECTNKFLNMLKCPKLENWNFIWE